MSGIVDNAALVGLKVPGSLSYGSLATGTTSIPLGADTVVVANAAITTNSVVLWSVNQAAPDNDAPVVSCVVGAGTITFNCYDSATPPVATNAAAAIPIRYLIAKY